MNIVLFDDACTHINRLVRILSFQRGNAFLMGLGGSGKQSCSELAAFILFTQIFKIDIGKD